MARSVCASIHIATTTECKIAEIHSDWLAQTRLLTLYNIALQHDESCNLIGFCKNKTAKLTRTKKNAQLSPDPYPCRGQGLGMRLHEGQLSKKFVFSSLLLIIANYTIMNIDHT